MNTMADSTKVPGKPGKMLKLTTDNNFDDGAVPCCSSSITGRVKVKKAQFADSDDQKTVQSPVSSDEASSQGTSSVSSVSEELQSNMEKESLEFALLKPICSKILQSPSAENLAVFEEAFEAIEKYSPEKFPVHMAEYVIFPFAIHLKIIKTYRETQRIEIYRTLAKLLKNVELCNSYDMFVNIFQKLHVALTVSDNLTNVNTQLSEAEMESIMECIHGLVAVSFPYHVDSLCLADKVQIFGHAIYIELQMLSPDIAKSVRLQTIESLSSIMELCDGRDNRSKVLYKFLPGIVSNLRKICVPSAGHSTKAIVLKSLALMGTAIRICTEFEEPEDLSQADGMLCQILDLLSKEFVLNTEVTYRKSFFNFCVEISTRQKQLPQCCKVISSIILRMKGDEDIFKSGPEVETNLEGVIQEFTFEDTTNLLRTAMSSLHSGHNTACILALREASSMLSSKKISFIEFQTLLPLIFEFMNDIVWKIRTGITLSAIKSADPVFPVSARLCQTLVLTVDVNEVVWHFSALLSDTLNNPNTTEKLTGIITTFNIVLSSLSTDNSSDLSASEASSLAELYLSLVELQSTETVLEKLAAEIPAVQSAAEIRKTCLLEGLGILGKFHPDYVVPIILYPLIEHAGSRNSDAVSDAAIFALTELAGQENVDLFLRDRMSIILNEISVRMLNLTLYPHCPSALIFLAEYFDFSQEVFATLIEQVFERCSDDFGGGHVQQIYVKIYYALIKSISNHSNVVHESSPTNVQVKETLLQKLITYQKLVGVVHPLDKHGIEIMESNGQDVGNAEEDDLESMPEQSSDAGENVDEHLDSTLQLVLKISHRVLNFLSNNERDVRLTAMDCLILTTKILNNHENSLLPLSHQIWQYLIPRLNEKDYVVVRKSFELLQALCTSCGIFLKKRTVEEVFPKFSALLITLAKEGEQVKQKNRQYYATTLAYKLQLTVLQGMAALIDSLDVQEFDLDKIVTGCVMYMSPDQHKNLREASKDLLKDISVGKRCRTVWMKLIACGFIPMPQANPHTSFSQLPTA